MGILHSLLPAGIFPLLIEYNNLYLLIRNCKFIYAGIWTSVKSLYCVLQISFHYTPSPKAKYGCLIQFKLN